MGFVADKNSGFVPDKVDSVEQVSKPTGFSLNNLTDKKTAPVGGLPLSIMQTIQSPMTHGPRLALSAYGIPEEDAAPAVGSVLGAILGTHIGHPNLGSGAGAASGEMLKQVIKKGVRGDGSNISVSDALIVGGGVAAGGKVLETAIKGAGLSTTLIPERARAKFFDKTLQAVNLGKKTLSRNWNTAVNKLVEENPETRINLSGVMTDLSHQIKNWGDDSLIPQLRAAVKHSPKLSQAVDAPGKAINLTLKEAQDLKNAITSTTNSITRAAVKGKTTPNERVVFDILDQIDDKITEQFPKMVDIRAVYKAGKGAFDMARPLVEPGKAIESSVFSQPKGLFGAGGTPFMGSTQGKLAFKDITSLTTPGKKMYESALLAHNLNRAADFVGRMGQIAVGGALAKKGLKLAE